MSHYVKLVCKWLIVLTFCGGVQLLDIACSGERYNAIIIESTGVGEPLHIAETFAHILDIADAHEQEHGDNSSGNGEAFRHSEHHHKRSRENNSAHDHSHEHSHELTHEHTHTHECAHDHSHEHPHEHNECSHEHTHDHSTTAPDADVHAHDHRETSQHRTIDGARALTFKQRIRLDCMVTVVDGSQVWTNFKSHTTNTQSCADTQTPITSATKMPADVVTAMEATANAEEPTISDLLLDQVQFANIIVVNKVDLLVDDDEDSDDENTTQDHKIPTLDEVMGLLQDLNPMATIIPSEYGDVKLSEIVNTKLFSFEEVRNSLFSILRCHQI
jgi:hypothetical protein